MLLPWGALRAFVIGNPSRFQSASVTRLMKGQGEGTVYQLLVMWPGLGRGTATKLEEKGKEGGKGGGGGYCQAGVQALKERKEQNKQKSSSLANKR